MKEWWQGLAIREKRSVFFGAFAVLFFLLYLLIYSPLENKVGSLRHQLEQNQKLLTWMKATDGELQALTNNPQNKVVNRASGSILSVTQNQINQSPIASNLTQLRQAETDSVQLNFSQVPFDSLAKWLTTIWQEQGLVITQMSISPTETIGSVKADIVLKKSE